MIVSRSGAYHSQDSRVGIMGRPFGRSVRAYELSPDRLALEAGFDRTYISLVEGVRSPTIRAVVKLAEILGVRPSEITQRMKALLKIERKRQTRGRAG